MSDFFWKAFVLVGHVVLFLILLGLFLNLVTVLLGAAVWALEQIQGWIGVEPRPIEILSIATHKLEVRFPPTFACGKAEEKHSNGGVFTVSDDWAGTTCHDCLEKRE